MIGWLGSVLFGIATIIAVLIAVWVLWEFVYEAERGRPIIQYHAFVCRIYLAGGVGIPSDARWTRRQFADKFSRSPGAPERLQ